MPRLVGMGCGKEQTDGAEEVGKWLRALAAPAGSVTHTLKETHNHL